MTKNIKTSTYTQFSSFVGTLILICAACASSLAQTPGTIISTTQSVTYSDGVTELATTSNTISFKVSNSAALAIIPDASSRVARTHGSKSGSQAR